MRNLFYYCSTIDLFSDKFVFETYPTRSEIIRGLSIIMLGPREIFLGLSVVMVGLYSTT